MQRTTRRLDALDGKIRSWHLSISALTFTTLVFLSCSHPRFAEYAIELNNDTDQHIDGVHLVFTDDSFVFTFGTVVSQGSASYENASAPLPNHATLTWLSADGQRHRARIHLPSIVKTKRQAPRGGHRLHIVITQKGSVDVLQSEDGDSSVSGG